MPSIEMGTIYAYLLDSGLNWLELVLIALGTLTALLTMHYFILKRRSLRALLPWLVLILSVVPLGAPESDQGSEGSVARQLGWGAAFLFALGLLLLQTRKKTAPFRWEWIPLPYLCLLAYALISAIWSFDIFVSLKRAIQLFGVLAIAGAFVRNRHGRDAITQMSWPAAVILLVGFAALAVPAISLDSDGNFRGITYTKNVWAQFALLSSLIFLYQLIAVGRNRWSLLCFLLASASLLATSSTTSISAYLLALAIIIFWKLSRKIDYRILVAGFGFPLVVVSFIYFITHSGLPLEKISEFAFEAAGKDQTLTGRTALWSMMVNEIARHFWFGAGYGGFWLGFDGPSSLIVRSLRWGPGQAHNGYLDVLNELGVVGVALLVTVLVAHCRNIYLLRRQENRISANLIFHIAVFACLLWLNISETSLLRTTHLWWIVFSISVIELKAQTSEIAIAYGQVGRTT